MNSYKLPEEKSIAQLTNKNLVDVSKDFVDNYIKFMSNEKKIENKKKELSDLEKLYSLNKYRDISIYKYSV
jgi:hypothetical protein